MLKGHDKSLPNKQVIEKKLLKLSHSRNCVKKLCNDFRHNPEFMES